MTDYAHPEVLVDTAFVQKHLNSAKVRIVEVDYDPAANYSLGHIPGAERPLGLHGQRGPGSSRQRPGTPHPVA